MKKKFVIINAFMSVVILFAIFFQSLHSYEHLAKELSEKKCVCGNIFFLTVLLPNARNCAAIEKILRTILQPT